MTLDINLYPIKNYLVEMLAAFAPDSLSWIMIVGTELKSIIWIREVIAPTILWSPSSPIVCSKTHYAKTVA